MKANEQTLQQVERTLRKVTEKFPQSEEASLLTDIHFRVVQETGEILVYDDEDKEITRAVVEQWIDNKEDNFYTDVVNTLRTAINKHKSQIENMSILKPYSLVLEDEEGENKGELYVVDDDTVIIDEELMVGLDKDLDDFLAKLLKE
jgi:hypothetical protein